MCNAGFNQEFFLTWLINSHVLEVSAWAVTHDSSCWGLLQVGAQFLALHYPLKLIYIPSPTWANHNKIFPLAGIQIRNYRYYKPSTRGLDYEVSTSPILH